MLVNQDPELELLPASVVQYTGYRQARGCTPVIRALQEAGTGGLQARAGASCETLSQNKKGQGEGVRDPLTMTTGQEEVGQLHVVTTYFSYISHSRGFQEQNRGKIIRN